MKYYVLFFCFLTNFSCAAENTLKASKDSLSNGKQAEKEKTLHELKAIQKNYRKIHLLSSFLDEVSRRLYTTTPHEIDLMVQELRFHLAANEFDEKEAFEEITKGIESAIKSTADRLNTRYDLDGIVVGGSLVFWGLYLLRSMDINRKIFLKTPCLI